jgi:hypothetical protein
MVVYDIDPQHGGVEIFARLVAEHPDEPLPDTFTTLSGRGQGSRHLYFSLPPGVHYKNLESQPRYGQVRLPDGRLTNGIDIKKRDGYLVAPNSIHPDTGLRYTCLDVPVASAPGWLLDLSIKPKPVLLKQFTSRATVAPTLTVSFWRQVTADDFNACRTWTEILGSQGWYYAGAGDPESHNAEWTRPGDVTSGPRSADVRIQDDGTSLLYVWSTSTQLQPGVGYTKFKAWAVLQFPAATEKASMRAAFKYLNNMK